MRGRRVQAQRGVWAVQRVDEYLKYAKQFRQLAKDAEESLRAQYDHLAKEWERLAKARLAEIQREIDLTASSTPKPATD